MAAWQGVAESRNGHWSSLHGENVVAHPVGFVAVLKSIGQFRLLGN